MIRMKRSSGVEAKQFIIGINLNTNRSREMIAKRLTVIKLYTVSTWLAIVIDQ